MTNVTGVEWMPERAPLMHAARRRYQRRVALNASTNSVAVVAAQHWSR